MNSTPFFSIYTPVYKGGKTIHRVFESVKSQTFKDFEWIVLNDASPDDSRSIIQNFIKDSAIDINFIDLDANLGFNQSFNLAVNQAKGKHFLVAHCDDEFTPFTLEIFASYIEKFEVKEGSKLQGVKCRCVDQYGSSIGDRFESSPFVSDIFELQKKRMNIGELWGTIRTDILKEFPFAADKKFVPESVVWNRIHFNYKAVFINDALRIYHVDHSETSLSKVTSKKTTIPDAKRIVYLDYVNLYNRRFSTDPVFIIKNFILYVGFSILAGISFKQMLKEINGTLNRIFVAICYPLGLLYSKM